MHLHLEEVCKLFLSCDIMDVCFFPGLSTTRMFIFAGFMVLVCSPSPTFCPQTRLNAPQTAGKCMYIVTDMLLTSLCWVARTLMPFLAVLGGVFWFLFECFRLFGFHSQPHLLAIHCPDVRSDPAKCMLMNDTPTLMHALR
jgi:hypothetical protein